MNGFPVLMYHALAAAPTTERYSLPEDRFRARLEALARAGRRGVALAGFLEGGAADARAVAPSFDDGHRSNRARALPVLQEFGCTATFFVTTGRIGTEPDFTDRDDVAALPERCLGRRPSAFSLPGGRCTAFALEAARPAGYRARRAARRLPGNRADQVFWKVLGKPGAA